MEFNRKSNKTGIFQPFSINLHETNKEGNTLLHRVASKGDLSAVKNLVNLDSSLIERKNNYGSTPLHFATWFGQLSSVEYLVQQGADLKTKDIYDQTLMHAAAWNGHVNLVKFFLQKNLPLEDKDQNGNTPLLSAAKNNHFQMVKLLIRAGADVEAKNNEGDNILFIAAKNGYRKIIKYFVKQKKLDLSEVKDNDDNTLLHLAVSNGHSKLVKYLLDLNLDLEAKNNDGNTPLNIAVENEDTNLVRDLLTRGAKEESLSEGNIRLRRIHQDNPEELGRYILKQNEDLLSNNVFKANPNKKKAQHSKKTHHNSSMQAITPHDAFDMKGLNESLTLANTTGFFKVDTQANQTELSPFTLSSISEIDRGISNSTNGTLLLANAIFNKPRKKQSSNVIDSEKNEQGDQIIKSINTYEFNSTAKPF